MSSDSNLPNNFYPQSTAPSASHQTPNPFVDPPGFFDHILEHSIFSDPPPSSWNLFADQRPTDSFLPGPFTSFLSEPSPPATYSFLDTILNPSSTADYLPFGYRRVSSPFGRLTSPFGPSPLPSERNSMAPTSNQRPARLPNGYVDLTAAPDSPPDPIPPPAQRKRRESPTPGPSSKRQKREGGGKEDRNKPTTPEKIEEIDLSADQTPAQEVLRKQREDAVKSQQKPEEKATTFNSFTCVICMDTPTDLTATACGHLFCHTCLMEALIAGENRTGPNEPKRSQCPVCRKFINRSKATDIIPLLLKKGLATQPRKSSTVTAPAKAA